MKRQLKKLTALALAISIVTGGALASCKKNADGDGGSGPTVLGSGRDSEHAEVLTGVYRPVDLPLPEGYCAGGETKNCNPLVDHETGAITALLTRKNTADADAPAYLIVTTDAEHGVTRSTPVTGIDGMSVTRWAFDGSGRCFFTAQRLGQISAEGYATYADNDIVLYRFDPPGEGETEGTLAKEVLLNPFFNMTDGFFIGNFIVDAEGDVWVEGSSGGTVGTQILFSPELVKVSESGNYNNMPMTPIPRSAGGGAATKLNSTPIGAKLTAKDGSVRRIELPELPDRVTFPFDGDGQTFYYSSDTGVWRAALDEHNNASVECLMNFSNSDVKTDVHGSGPDWSYLLAVLSEDCLLFTEREGLTLYTASGNIDLSTLRVIEIALGAERGWDVYTWPDLIVEYNKNHPDCRVVVTDYTLYNSTENPDGGIRKLATDIVTGIYKPDIVIGDYGGLLTQVMVRDHIYEDLSPYLSRDSEVNRDSLFDCVERMFADGEETWGLAAVVTLWGPFTSQSVLDKYAPDLTEESGWSLERMMDIIESLPDDVIFYEILRQDIAENYLLGPDGYSVFLDTEKGEAKFDSPLFLRWLKFYASLPKDYNEWRQTSPTANGGGKKNRLTSYDFAYQDRIFLQWIGFNDLEVSRAESLFGTKDWVFLGHPGEGHSGIDCRAENAFVMTKWCADKELCWDVIRTFMLNLGIYFGLPALESEFDALAERRDPEDRQYIVYFDGSTFGSNRDPDLTPDKLKKPGYIVLPEWSDFEHIRRLMNTAGYPMTEKVSSDISAIVAEEISAFVGGLGTAEDCAKKIQSRVEIWLAEHR